MISLNQIEDASRRIKGHLKRTPLVASPTLTELCGFSVALKLEHQQTTGSFKLRGATNAVLSLDARSREKGVVAASTGNYGRALAFAARAVGSRATICMSKLVPDNKVLEVRLLGADVRIIGSSQDDAQREVDRLVAEEGLTMLPPFDHPDIIAGQATVGSEILEDLPDVRTVLVPLSGGGLAAGVAAAIKSISPETRVIGISMRRGAAMKASLEAGRPVEVEEFPSLADSLGGGIGLDNRFTFSMCRDLLDDVILLSEAEIAAGILHAYRHEREMVEGAAAVGIAALIANKIPRTAGPVAVVLSGRNIDMDLHRRIVNGEQDPFGGDQE
jgi:threonine dehydratase